MSCYAQGAATYIQLTNRSTVPSIFKIRGDAVQATAVLGVLAIEFPHESMFVTSIDARARQC